VIVLTGVTGKLGSRTLKALRDDLPATELAVSVRDPGKVTDLGNAGISVRSGDYTDPASLSRSFAGADTLFLVSAAAFGDEAIRQHRNAIEAAQQAGIERIVYTSHQGASAESEFESCRDHATTEALLADSGMRWTALRNGFYADTISTYLAQAHEGVMYLPKDGPVSWTTHDDLAAAAAVVLRNGAAPDGPTPPLTASEVHGVASIAALAAEMSGRPYRHEVVDDDSYVANLEGYGVPPNVASALLGVFRASRAGEFDVVDPELASLVGRPPQTVETTVRSSVAVPSA